MKSRPQFRWVLYYAALFFLLCQAVLFRSQICLFVLLTWIILALAVDDWRIRLLTRLLKSFSEVDRAVRNPHAEFMYCWQCGKRFAKTANGRCPLCGTESVTPDEVLGGEEG